MRFNFIDRDTGMVKSVLDPRLLKTPDEKPDDAIDAEPRDRSDLHHPLPKPIHFQQEDPLLPPFTD